jgi:hypothetical protein
MKRQMYRWVLIPSLLTAFMTQVEPAQSVPKALVCQNVAGEIDPDSTGCVEMERQPFSWGEKTIVIRSIRRKAAASPAIPAWSSLIIADVQESLANYLITFDLKAIDHISVQIDDAPDPDGNAFTNVEGPFDNSVAVGKAATVPKTDDCFIWLSILVKDIKPSQLTADALKMRIAHEVFHCLLGWNFGGHGGASAWWEEGSAKAMEMLVTEWPQSTIKWAKEFDSTSAKTPITGMAYEAYPFWAWLFNRDKDRVISLFDQAPQGSLASDPQSQLKMFNTLDESEAFGFAAGYVGAALKTVSGTVIPLTLDAGTTATIAAAGGQVHVKVKAATLYRSTIVLMPGEYTIKNIGGGTPPTGFRDHATGFVFQTRLSAHVVAPCGSTFSGLLFTLPLEDAEFDVGIERTKEIDCSATPLVSAAGHDDCVAGIWSLDLPALKTFFSSILPGVTIQQVKGSLSYVFDGSGDASILANDIVVAFDAPLLDRGKLRVLIAVKGIDHGAKWGTNDDGVLVYTPGDNKIRIAIVAGTADTGALVMEDAIKSFKAPGSYRYECVDDRMVLKVANPNGADFQFNMKRF